jgi:hypothetical protein
MRAGNRHLGIPRFVSTAGFLKAALDANAVEDSPYPGASIHSDEGAI